MDKKLEKIQEMTIGKIEELGFNLYYLQFVEEEGEKYLRFHVTKKDGSQVGLDDCETVSRAVSEIIDEKDPIKEAYFLEVQSAGDFRELFTNDHFENAIGERVLVFLKNKIKGSNKFNAILEKNELDAITIKTDKEEIEIKKDNIDSVSLNPQI